MTPQQSMIVDAFNSQVYVDNKMDVQHTPLYDTVTIAAGNPFSVLTSALFTNVGASSGKTLALTNLTQSQKLAAPEAFSVFGFRFRYSREYLPVGPVQHPERLLPGVLPRAKGLSARPPVVLQRWRWCVGHEQPDLRERHR